MAIVRATNHVESPPKERYLRSAWIPPLFSLPIFFSLNLAGDEMRGTSRIVERRGFSPHFAVRVWCLMGLSVVVLQRLWRRPPSRGPGRTSPTASMRLPGD